MIALIRFVLALLASPFKSKSRLEAENAMLRHQLIVLQRRGAVAFTSRMGIAFSWSSDLDGFHRSSKPARSPAPRPSCVGIGPPFVGTGVGNPARLEADRRSPRIYA